MSLFITRDLAEAGKRFSQSVATLGTFDGVHLGHQAILSEVLLRAMAGNRGSVVLTFDPHPQEVVSPQNAPYLLSTLEEKQSLIAALGMDALVVLPFNRVLADMEPEVFVREFLWPRLRMSIMVLGQDSKFGHKRRGDVTLLSRLGGELGFQVVPIPPVLDGGMAISSTRIRKLLIAGEVKEAKMLLGRPYTLTGVVIQGKERGRSLGFPTANLEIIGARRQLVKEGVYAIQAKLDGIWHNGLISIGVRPTFNETVLEHEVYLFNFTRDLYGQILEVAFIFRLRDQVAFQSADELVAQMKLDEKEARGILAQCPPDPGILK